MPRRKQNVRLGRQLEFTVKKVFYLGYFSDIDKEKNRRGFPSADTKMQYVMDAMTKEGYDVEVLSFCGNDKRDCVWKKDDGYNYTAGHVCDGCQTVYPAACVSTGLFGADLPFPDVLQGG